MTNEEIRSECNEAVRGPGKYEGEASYVPYFWDRLEWASEDHGRTLEFTVSAEDVVIFPDLLEEGQSVFLYESDSGFVCETSGPGDDDFEHSNDEDGWEEEEEEEEESLVIIFIDRASVQFVVRDWVEGCPTAKGCHSGHVMTHAEAEEMIEGLIADGYEKIRDF